MQYEEVTHSLEECESLIKSLKNTHNSELEKLSREHEDKVLYMLSKMNNKEVREFYVKISLNNLVQNASIVILHKLHLLNF